MRWSKLNWVFGAVALYACSFQNFDYLNEGAGGNSNPSGGTGTGKGGSGGAGAGSGGTTAARGGSAGEVAFGGASGESGAAGAGAGGEGAVGQGGVPGAGGTGTVGSGGKGSGGTAGGTVGAGGASLGGNAGRGGTASGGATSNPTLVNPSFESALTGWTVDPPDAGPSGKRYVYTQAPTDSSKPPHGSQELATWHDKDSYQVSVSQTLRGLKDGVYTFQGYFSSDRSGGTFMFARNCGGPDREVQVPTTSWTWFPYAINNVEVVGGTCEVGVRIIGAPNDYLNADLFTFELNPEGAGGAGGAGGG